MGCSLLCSLTGISRCRALFDCFAEAVRCMAVGMVDAVYFTAVILLIIVSSVATPLALKTLFAKHPSDHPSAVAVNESGKA